MSHRVPLPWTSPPLSGNDRDERPVETATLRRFRAKYVVQTDDCWRWTGSKNRKGYGHFRFEGRVHRAHRVSYWLFVGVFDPALVIDHLCRNPSCVNPSHLEPVTRGLNTLRGDTFVAKNVAKTHCPKGHEYSDQNTYIYKNRRDCRTCRRERVARCKGRKS